MKSTGAARPSLAALGTPAQRAGGFTLIEIVLALLVIGVGLVALIVSAGQYAANAATLREKTVALWVAHNRLTEIELEPAWPELGRSDGEVELARAEWRWDVTVSETPDPRVRRIDITVKRRKADENAAELSSFVEERRQ